VIVVDASAMVEALVGSTADAGLLDALSGDIDAPHLLDVEVLSLLRGLVLAGKLDPEDAARARQDHFAFTITRHETAALAERIWQLRNQFTGHDASYLALAEALGAPLFTCDARLATRGHNAQVHLISQTPGSLRRNGG
jgi:predicted nucleic acid-binding protein